MRKTVPILVTILAVAVGWIFFKNFTVTGINEVRVVPKSELEQSSAVGNLTRRVTDLLHRQPSDLPPRATQDEPHRDGLPRIRIATFNTQSLDHAKISRPEVLDLMARIGREFDVLALQKIRSEADNVLPVLLKLMNKTGSAYDYAIGPRVGPKGAEEQYAFLFNRQTVILDRSELYTVDDRSNVLTYEPFVAWFRALGPPANEGFTFSLVNVRLDPATAVQEQDVLDDLFIAVRDDGREEDDVILAGDFQAGPGRLGPFDGWKDAGYAIALVPTNVLGTASWDNIIFHKAATAEFTGNSGVLDFLRKYNLTVDQALEISDHLVVWAEFSVYEGGEVGRVARAITHQPTTPHTQLAWPTAATVRR